MQILIMHRIVISLLLLIFFLPDGSAQDSTNDIKVYDGIVIDGDTIIIYELKAINIRARYTYEYRKRMRQYNKLAKKVKKVYPYALLLEEKLDSMSIRMDKLASERKRKEFVKQKEKELFKQFEKEIMKLTISEGLVLVKLIDRQTGDTSYELIKELRGSITAFFWQGIARFFGNDLKAEYDPETIDAMIEDIVQRIEAGEL
jgi:hypothetical protein